MTRTHRHSTLLAAAVLIAGALAVTSAAQQTAETAPVSEGLAKATFAGGCFWCMEPPFDELDGVISTTSGYTGGNRRHPAYQQVASGQTTHAEAVEIVYDPSKISYAQLLEVFWMNVDPLTRDRQFCDGGAQYRTAIFVHGDKQARLARDTKQQLDDSGRFDRPVVTQIVEAGEFWAAEDYHQDYYLKNPIRYKFYRYGCGRDKRLDELWGEG
jgi:peptide-methionine (S)-S-oxide reductase